MATATMKPVRPLVTRQRQTRNPPRVPCRKSPNPELPPAGRCSHSPTSRWKDPTLTCVPPSNNPYFPRRTRQIFWYVSPWLLMFSGLYRTYIVLNRFWIYLAYTCIWYIISSREILQISYNNCLFSYSFCLNPCRPRWLPGYPSWGSWEISRNLITGKTWMWLG